MGRDGFRGAQQDQLMTLPKMTRKKAERIAASILENTAEREILTELGGYGISTLTGHKLFTQYGQDTVYILKTDPYRICEIDGIGFTTADRIAQKTVFNGKPFAGDSALRIKAGLIYAAEQALTTAGNLFLSQADLLKTAKELLETDINGNPISISPEVYEQALDELVNDRGLKKDSGNVYYLPYSYAAEINVAELVNKHLGKTSSGDYDNVVRAAAGKIGFSPSAEQIDAAVMVLRNSFSIITGGPGTGKTSVIRTVIEACKSLSDEDFSVALAAPTGRAARRMTESCGYPAYTIHKLLGLKPNQSGAAAELTEVTSDLLIIDEFSMVDMFLANHLMKNISEKTKVVCVGDADQLPSVGPGAVFAELIASGTVPVTRLTKIFRQSGEGAYSIVLNSQKIRDGDPFLTYTPDFQCVTAEDANHAQWLITYIYEAELRAAGEGGTDKVQVLSPRRTDVATSVQKLNPLLRSIAHQTAGDNMEGYSVTVMGTQYFKGDKVMQTKNTDTVANGDIGYIRDIAVDDGDPLITIDFGDNRIERYFKSDMENVVLAYACTIHKSQGSEYDTVIIPIMSEHYVMLERSLFYTAVTRAKKRVIIITNDSKYIFVAVENHRSETRNTRLATKLRTCVNDGGDRQ